MLPDDDLRIQYQDDMPRGARIKVIGVGGGAPEGSDKDYLENYLETDVRVPRVNRAPRCSVLDDRQLISADELRSSAFHHEFLPRYDLGYLAHVNLARSPRFTTIVTFRVRPSRSSVQSSSAHHFPTRRRIALRQTPTHEDP